MDWVPAFAGMAKEGVEMAIDSKDMGIYKFLLKIIWNEYTPLMNKSAGFYVRYFTQKQRLEKSCLVVLGSLFLTYFWQNYLP